MRKWLLVVAGVVVALVGVFVLVVAMQPSEYRVERSLTMSAPPEAIFPEVNNLRQWQHWSPWAKLDPNAKNTFDGPSSGEGAVFKWSGNDEVGEGTMTIVESRENEFVSMRLDFVRPFEDTGMSEFTFKPEGDKTTVVWAMHGRQPFMGKLMCLFMDMDAMLGTEFEKGLASLRKIAEAKSMPPSDPSPAESS